MNCLAAVLLQLMVGNLFAAHSTFLSPEFLVGGKHQSVQDK